MAERLLVVAPHPDDESLGAAALIAKERQRGTEVFVVLATLGDGFMEDAARYYLSFDVKPEEYLHMGYERQKETIRAMAELGVDESRIYFLGFPDGGLDSLWRTHWDGEPWTSVTTGKKAVPYLTAWRPDTPYLGRRMLDLLLDVYEEVRPDRIVLPSAFDTHPDHWATNAFATLAWAEMAQGRSEYRRIARWGYLVHWPAWPFPLAYRPDLTFSMPKSLLYLGQEPSHAEPVNIEHIERKRRALMAHESQAELIKPFMLAFCRQSEAFWQEHLWRAQLSGGGAGVRNPVADWRTRLVRRHHPLMAAVWGRGPDFDHVEVTVNGRLAHDSRLEICLHPVGGRRLYQWMAGPGENIPHVRYRAGTGAVQIMWPREWIGDAGLVMAGVQLYVRGKCEGKIPFRPVVWPKSG